MAFSELFSGQASDAARKLSAETGLSLDVLAPAREELLRLLTSLAGWPLTAAMRVFPAKRDAHSEFTARMLDGGMDSFYVEYPELSRLATLCVKDWMEAGLEFARRLNKDRRALVRTFGDGAASEVVRLDVSLSDRHTGRTVIGVTFAAGLKLIYKPRDMAMERAWFDLLDWLNSHGAPVDQRVIRILEKFGYGWEEFVPATPCLSRGNARDFYARAGALQSLLYVLNGTDMHMGNLIACGPWPVLVDAECLLQPRRGSDGDRDADEGLVEDLLHAGLLPRPKIVDMDPFDLSGLAGGGGQPTDYRVPVWEQGSFAFVQGVLLPQSNLPTYKGRALELKNHRDVFIQGFENMHKYLQDRRAELPLQPLFACPSRVLLHTTRYYMALLSQSVRPRFLRDRKLRSAMLRESLRGQEPVLPKTITEAEAAAIEDLNVPHFSAPGGRSLTTGYRLLFPSYFEESGQEVALARLGALSEQTREQQVSTLRILFALSSLSG